MRATRRNRRIRDLAPICMLYNLLLLGSTRKAQTARSTLPLRLAFLRRHRAIGLRDRHTDYRLMMLLRAMCKARRVNRGAIAGRGCVVRARSGSGCACAAGKERLVVLVLAHTATARATGARSTRALACFDCTYAADDTGLVVIWCHFGTCEVRRAYVSHDAVWIKVAVKVVASAPVASPAE